MSELTISTGSRWILVVEDNPDDEQLATRVFKKSARKEAIMIARDGEEALAMLKDRHAPCIVLLDLKLPRLSGVEVLMAIKDDPKLSVVPIVILTSSDEKSDRMACYELGCNAFVRKAIDYDRFKEELKVTLDFWLDINMTASD